ncbi:predicted protein [Naegleria gruberi]|uniref:non-specific serine/threonine protein kinase n=1 Tax=Naegleria gruberi TaxID=5762 RepID=D2W2C2_NAEGR|nr:uncharacterized protein NAEGRDRAFT_54158 [Naegleria gruberi]EFC36801.1 predicted protein [Naegleria gruberi]|eukprot:XP_002669545.1 predicted protein [Naegleria gruberi strain NEG-M]
MNIFKCSISSDKSNNNQQQEHLAREDPVTHQLIVNQKKKKKNQTLPPNSFTLIGTNNKNYIYKPLKKLSSGASNTSDVWQIELIEPHDIKGIYALKRIKLDDIDNYDYGSNLLLKQTIDMNIDKNCVNSTTLSDLEHLNIVKYFDSFISQNIGGKYLNILQEFCITSLQKLFDLKQDIPISYQIQWSLHIAQALKYIHDECKIIHRDVKPDNILLKKVISNNLPNLANLNNNNLNNNSNNNSANNDGGANNEKQNNLSINTTIQVNNGNSNQNFTNINNEKSPASPQSKLIIKLADFDYAKKVDLSNAKTFVGSQEYFAPEIINSLNNYNLSKSNGMYQSCGNNGVGSSSTTTSSNGSNHTNDRYYYTHKVDIWSFGIVAFQLIKPIYRLNIPKFREELQKNPNYVKELLKDHLNISSSNFETQRKPQSLPNSNNHLYLQCLAQIIVDCLQLDPTARPEAKDIVRNIEIIYYSTYTKFNSPVKPPNQQQQTTLGSSTINEPPPNSVLTRTSLSSDKSSSSTQEGINHDTACLLNKSLM